MRLISVRALAALFLLSWTLTSCGGGNHLAEARPRPHRRLRSFSLAQAITPSWHSPSIRKRTPTETASVSGNQGGFGIVANPSVTFLYADDEIADGIDAGCPILSRSLRKGGSDAADTNILANIHVGVSYNHGSELDRTRAKDGRSCSRWCGH